MTDVYRCLSRVCWSIRESGRVVGHAAALALQDVTFRVSAAGCARIRQRSQREVVAYARGFLTESGTVPPGALRVRFDPFAAAAFTLPDGSPISAAAHVSFLADGTAWAVPHPLECPMRSVVVALVLLVASPAAAELWPTGSTGWRYALTVPSGPGRQRYGYVDADPRPPGGWLVTVTCGEERTTDGRVLSRVVGRGTSTRGAAPGFGGAWDWDDGRRGGSFVVTQDLRRPEALALPGEFTAPECPRRGVGQLSTGD